MPPGASSLLCSGVNKLDLPVKAWYDAIFVRHSRRTYLSAPLTDNEVLQLKRVCDRFRPFPEARAELVLEPPDKVFKGLIGAYGKVKGAPSYIAFIGDLSSQRVHEAVGYTGEGIILEATSMGLATCWVGGFFRPEQVAAHLTLGRGEKVLAVTPVGHAPDDPSPEEKVIKRLVSSHRRKPLDHIARGFSKTSPEWMRRALEAARLAPSALNRQPWRFSVESESITVSVTAPDGISGISSRLDCGIAMLHLELGALLSGVRGVWDFLAPPTVARYTKAHDLCNTDTSSMLLSGMVVPH